MFPLGTDGVGFPNQARKVLLEETAIRFCNVKGRLPIYILCGGVRTTIEQNLDELPRFHMTHTAQAGLPNNGLAT
jgi:hypothetical protein